MEPTGKPSDGRAHSTHLKKNTEPSKAFWWKIEITFKDSSYKIYPKKAASVLTGGLGGLKYRISQPAQQGSMPGRGQLRSAAVGHIPAGSPVAKTVPHGAGIFLPYFTDEETGPDGQNI